MLWITRTNGKKKTFKTELEAAKYARNMALRGANSVSIESPDGLVYIIKG